MESIAGRSVDKTGNDNYLVSGCKLILNTKSNTIGKKRAHYL